MLTFKRLDLESADWGKQLESFDDRMVYQTPEWLRFVAETQQAEPVLAAIEEGNKTVGYFTGLIVRKFGLKILGSPFPGWTTSYMGFNLLEGVSRRAAVEALIPFAFDSLKCIHFELMDRHLIVEDLAGLGMQHQIYCGYQVDVSSDEESVLASIPSHSCRRGIRRAAKKGVVIEEADASGFVEDYYEQLKDVFAKQSLVPTYGIERVQALVRHLHPSGHLLLLRARDSEGRCIATRITPGYGKMMYGWGSASWRAYQHLCPNEILVWHAIKYWKQRGAILFDMAGGGSYKQKYGGESIEVPWFRRSKYASLERARNAVRRLFILQQRIRGRFSHTEAARKGEDA